MALMADIQPHIVVLNSITKLNAGHAGCVVVSGSHGGIYPATLASAAALRGVVFSDAGIGLERAGIAGLALLDEVGLPAIAADYRSARIGDGADILARGRVSHVNEAAARLGCRIGESVSLCSNLMKSAEPTLDALPMRSEGRVLLRTGAPPIWGVDSNSLVEPTDAGALVVSGSHGGLLGGDPASAIALDVRAAAFNDAGIGIDKAGISRLAALERRGIAAVTVSATSARIGDAASAWETGVLSAYNAEAARFGADEGVLLSSFLTAFAAAIPGSTILPSTDIARQR